MEKPNDETLEQDGPTINYRTIKRPEGYNVKRAIKSLSKLATPGYGKEATVRREEDFLYLASQVDNLREARVLRDQVIAALSGRGLSRDEWGQRVISVMNDAVETYGGEAKKRSPKKSKKRKVERPQPQPARVSQVTEAARAEQSEVVDSYREAVKSATDEGKGQMLKELKRDFLELARREGVTGQQWVQEILGVLRGSGVREGQIRTIVARPKKKGKSARMQAKKAAQREAA